MKSNDIDPKQYYPKFVWTPNTFVHSFIHSFIIFIRGEKRITVW
jgi:hypothetical protein